MQVTAGEVGTNSQVTHSCGPTDMDVQRQDDQLEQQLCAGTGCRLEDPPEAMDDREG